MAANNNEDVVLRRSTRTKRRREEWHQELVMRVRTSRSSGDTEMVEVSTLGGQPSHRARKSQAKVRQETEEFAWSPFCAGCGYEHELASAKFCMQCGTKRGGSINKFCAGCGYEHELASAKFCMQCGTKRGETEEFVEEKNEVVEDTEQVMHI